MHTYTKESYWNTPKMSPDVNSTRDHLHNTGMVIVLGVTTQV